MAVFDLHDLISLDEAGKLLPDQPTASTLRRWSLYGYEGIRLVTYRIGKERVTTIKDMLQFIADLNDYELDPKELDEYRRQREQQRRKQTQDAGEVISPIASDQEVNDDFESAYTAEEEREREQRLGFVDDDNHDTPRRSVLTDSEAYPAY